VPDLSEVLFNITADGCAFYSIPFPTQPLFLNFFIGCAFFPQNQHFFMLFIYFLSIFHYFFHIKVIFMLCFLLSNHKI